MGVPDEALRQVETYCVSHVPERLRDEVRVECSKRGSAITIVERRPPWKPEYGPEWSKLKVAQLRYEEDADIWTLHCADHNGRWFLYEPNPRGDLQRLLNEIEVDPTGIFWG